MFLPLPGPLSALPTFAWLTVTYPLDVDLTVTSGKAFPDPRAPQVPLLKALLDQSSFPIESLAECTVRHSRAWLLGVCLDVPPHYKLQERRVLGSVPCFILCLASCLALGRDSIHPVG